MEIEVYCGLDFLMENHPDVVTSEAIEYIDEYSSGDEVISVMAFDDLGGEMGFIVSKPSDINLNSLSIVKILDNSDDKTLNILNKMLLTLCNSACEQGYINISIPHDDNKIFEGVGFKETLANVFGVYDMLGEIGEIEDCCLKRMKLNHEDVSIEVVKDYSSFIDILPSLKNLEISRFAFGVIAKANGLPLGFSIAELEKDDDCLSGDVSLLRITSDDEFARSGFKLGVKMLSVFMSTSIDMGLQNIRMDAKKEALPFYEKIGFSIPKIGGGSLSRLESPAQKISIKIKQRYAKHLLDPCI